MLHSPYQKLSKPAEKKLTIVLFIAVIILIVLMRYIDSIIQSSDNSLGIVSFELAKNVSKSEAILNSWNTLSKTFAGISLGLDFLFLLLYSLFISLLIHKLNEQLWKHSRIYKLGIIFMFGVFLAAFCDIVENIALIQLLQNDLQQKWSSIAYYAAVSKFSLLLIAILFIILNSIFLLFKKNKLNKIIPKS